MKIINLLIKIANNELADGTRVIIENKLYIYNNKNKHLEVSDKRTNYRVFSGEELNETAEIIPVMENITQD